MKKLLLLFYFVFITYNVFAQDPGIYGSWELSRIEIDANPGVEISEIEPPIAPWLTINELLEFNGFGACNSFFGNYIYDAGTNKFESVDFQETLLNCATELHNALEDEYFGYFNGILYSQPMGISVFIGNDGLEHMHIGNGSPGFWLDFVRAELAIVDLTKNRIQIYPNPAQDVLSIESQQPIESVKIYNLQGQLIKKDSSNSVDVSQLTTGLYFAQVTVEGNTITKKFIKE